MQVPVDAAKASTNDSTSQRMATSGQSGGRRKACGMREVGPATHSLPFLERRSAPFFHEDVTPPSSMRPQPVRRAGFGRRGGARRAKLWDVWTLAAVCRPNPCFLPPACANQKPLGSGGLVVVAVRCRCLCLCRCLSSLASGRFNVDVSLGVSLAFLLALNVIPREGSRLTSPQGSTPLLILIEALEGSPSCLARGKTPDMHTPGTKVQYGQE